LNLAGGKKRYTPKPPKTSFLGYIRTPGPPKQNASELVECFCFDFYGYHFEFGTPAGNAMQTIQQIDRDVDSELIRQRNQL